MRITSFSASELRPVTSPTLRGSRGSGFLRPASNRPSSARARRSRSSRSRRSPSPTGRIPRPSMDSRPVLAQKSGLSWATTRMPFSSGRSRCAVSLAKRVTGTEISASTSRRVT
ncbi:hypothetical protein BJF77_08555 [Kocuria sp. CNJ-770]|nr:hypothetical protein BJF77_08555 [Kocuria sp. CNJ-770]